MSSTQNQEEPTNSRQPMPADKLNSEGVAVEHSSRPAPSDTLAPSGANAPAQGDVAQNAATERLSATAVLVATLKEIAQIVLPAVALAALIHFFLAQATIVHGQSMQPNLRPHERLIMEKLSYHFHRPRHNEIVILDLPESNILMIKRVVGLPGDTVEIQQGRVFVNGSEVKTPSGYGESRSAYGPVTLKEDTYFVLGDNRDNSNDSRAFGPVHRDVIKGRVWVRYWPLTRFTVFTSSAW